MKHKKKKIFDEIKKHIEFVAETNNEDNVFRYGKDLMRMKFKTSNDLRYN